MLKVINITIPNDKILPYEVNSFSPEENYKILKIGSECLMEGRKAALEISQKDIYQKIKDEQKDEIKKLELDILVERELKKKIEEELSKIYELQIEQVKKQNEKLETIINDLKKQINIYEIEKGNLKKELEKEMEKEVNKNREKYDLLLQEKDNQNKLNREAVEKLQESVYYLTNKSTSLKGSEGEKEFSDYAETFIDFVGFEIKDKHTQSNAGDFHLHFEEFDILVDTKNYKRKVPIDQREKIKKDLIKNEHINFAWLVSLNSSIDKWDKSPIMFEWVNTKQCIVYINNLSSYEDPKKILRIVWFTCKELFNKLVDETEDNTEFLCLKEKQFKVNDKIKNIRKNIRELNTNINVFKNLIQNMDEQLREILETETTSIVNSNFSLYDDWWEENIEIKKDNNELSSDLWIRFRQDKKDFIKENDLTVEKFRRFIKTKIPLSNLIMKTKNPNSAFEIKGIKLKEINLIPKEKIDVEIVEDELPKKNFKNKKHKD
jgi:hypothetical protein